MLAGDEDKEMFENLESVSERFGGSLETSHVKGMSHLKKHVQDGGVAVHLTMYGEPFRKAIPKIRRDRPVVIVVGGAKVPGDVYKICQHNVAVGINLTQKLLLWHYSWMRGLVNLQVKKVRRCSAHNRRNKRW